MKPNKAPQRRFFIESLGCSKNQVDTETIIELMENDGWTWTQNSDDSDLIIVNSCGFIAPAKEESINTVLDFRDIYPDKKIIMAGCLAERYIDELYTELTELDGICGNQDLSEVVEAADAVMENNRPHIHKEKYVSYSRTKHLLNFPGSAFVKIAEGCNNRCSFCAIPLIRGNVKSRTITEIIEEIKTLLANGVKEFNLVAQDLSNFGIDRGAKELKKLLETIQAIEADFWVRLLYIHPDHFPQKIFTVFKEDSRFLPYFDIPFQHAAPELLKKMNRQGNPEEYLNLIKAIRSAIPHAVIRSTFMTGFPGETEEHFQTLKKFIQSADLDWVGFFTYSREEDTPAFDMETQEEYDSSTEIAEKRKVELEKIQQEISQRRVKQFVGLETKVLVEEAIEEEELFFGRIYSQAPEVDGVTVIHAEGLTPGTFVDVTIKSTTEIDLQAWVK